MGSTLALHRSMQPIMTVHTLHVCCTCCMPQVLAPQPGDVRLEVTGSAHLPSGWLLCDGQDVPRATYKNLFMAIGVTQGRGNGRSTFNLPDMRHLQQQLGLQHVRAIIYAGANN